MFHVAIFKAPQGTSGPAFNTLTHGAPADAIVNASVDGLDTRAFLEIFNGVTLDRVRTANAAAATTGTGLLGVGLLVFDGANWVRPAAATPADAQAGTNSLFVSAFNNLFNGATWDRGRNSSAANIAATTQPFAQISSPPGNWSSFHTPAASAQATITKAAGGAGVRHVCTQIAYSLRAVVAQTAFQINLIDGASGGATILWSMTVMLNTGAYINIVFPSLNIFGSANTAMTLEFSAAPVASNVNSVAMTGFSTI